MNLFFFGLVALFFLPFFLFFLPFNFFNFLINFFYFFILMTLFFPFFLSFFLPFLLSHLTDRVLVLRPGVRPVPLNWESPVQDIHPPETSRFHVISNGKRSPRDHQLNTKIQLHSTTNKLQCWTPCDKQLAREERNHTH